MLDFVLADGIEAKRNSTLYLFSSFPFSELIYQLREREAFPSMELVQ